MSIIFITHFLKIYRVSNCEDFFICRTPDFYLFCRNLEMEKSPSYQFAIDSLKITRSRSDLFAYCSNVIADRIVNGVVKCSVCQFQSSARRFRPILDHALFHFPKGLFSCRLCDRRFNSRSAIRCHLSKMHDSRLPSDISDDTDMHIDEIKLVIDHCYGRLEDEDW